MLPRLAIHQGFQFFNLLLSLHRLIPVWSGVSGWRNAALQSEHHFYDDRRWTSLGPPKIEAARLFR